MTLEYQRKAKIKPIVSWVNVILLASFILPILSFNFMQYWWVHVEGYHRGYSLMIATAIACATVSLSSLIFFYKINKVRK